MPISATGGYVPRATPPDWKDEPRCKGPSALRGGSCIKRPEGHPKHSAERHRIETSDESARAGGYYGVYDPRQNVSVDEKLDEARGRYGAIFRRAATRVAINPETARLLTAKPDDVTVILRYWIPAHTFYVGDDEMGIAP